MELIPFSRPEPVLGYETQAIGGMILNPGNSMLKDLSISRAGMLPHFHEENVLVVLPVIQLVQTFALFGKKKPTKKVVHKCFLKELIINIAKAA